MNYKGWESFGEPVGKGGQGTVYKARRPSRVEELVGATKILNDTLSRNERRMRNNAPASIDDTREVIGRLIAAMEPDKPADIGALKVFEMPDDEAEQKKTLERLRYEIHALQEIQHPAILAYREASYIEADNGPFLITEYHPNGTLHEHLDMYNGKALGALVAFRPLVEAVARLHEGEAIHRDIKPKNIFVASDGRLVLGDFGIVLFRDDSHERVTETYGRPGSRDWMAPWVNLEHRFALEEINGTLDVFPLGKVLWCMISGRHQLQLWYYKRRDKGSVPATDLEILFPDDPAMVLVNDLLGKCVVEDESQCLKTARDLLAEVDRTIRAIRTLGRLPGDNSPWFCLVCNRGHYQAAGARMWRGGLADARGNVEHFDMRVYFCDNCGHVELFGPKPAQ